MNNYLLTLLQVPAVTQKRYAELSGLTLDVVRGQVSRVRLNIRKHHHLAVITDVKEMLKRLNSTHKPRTSSGPDLGT